jgi:hypothetical protein
MPDEATTDETTESETQRPVIKAVEAREQANTGRYSFLRSEFRLGVPTDEHPQGEVFEIPHRDLLDNDQQERWDNLQDAMRTYQREPDLFTPDGSTLIARGSLINPHHDADGKRLPAWGERLATVLWGKEGAVRAKKAKINFNEIEIIWQKQLVEMEERFNRDPKS